MGPTNRLFDYSMIGYIRDTPQRSFTTDTVQLMACIINLSVHDLVRNTRTNPKCTRAKGMSNRIMKPCACVGVDSNVRSNPGAGCCSLAPM